MSKKPFGKETTKLSKNQIKFEFNKKMKKYQNRSHKLKCQTKMLQLKKAI